MSAALRTVAPPAAAKEIAETEDVAEVAENVLEAGEDTGVEPARGRRHSGVSEAVVHRALLGVGQDGVRFGSFFELVFGGVVARVFVGVELHRELAIRALDFHLGRGPHHAEHLVVVALAHAFATFTIAGRNSRSLIVYPLRSSPITSPSR